jgi:CxxC motif-containing protein (DUF1111 family)
MRAYLHDGRARTLTDAITAHESEGSEANAAVARFKALSEADRATLLDFVQSL